jgi:hypothetical protein
MLEQLGIFCALRQCSRHGRSRFGNTPRTKERPGEQIIPVHVFSCLQLSARFGEHPRPLDSGAMIEHEQTPGAMNGPWLTQRAHPHRACILRRLVAFPQLSIRIADDPQDRRIQLNGNRALAVGHGLLPLLTLCTQVREARQDAVVVGEDFQTALVRRIRRGPATGSRVELCKSIVKPRTLLAWQVVARRHSLDAPPQDRTRLDRMAGELSPSRHAGGDGKLVRIVLHGVKEGVGNTVVTQLQLDFTEHRDVRGIAGVE